MSTEPLTISIEQDARPEILMSIDSLLDEEADKRLGYPVEMLHFCAVLRNSSGGIEGGIKARCYWEWLRVDALAVAPKWRGQGYGRSLLVQAEEWGLNCSCHDVWLMTMGPEARRFYEQAGYRIFAELPNFPGTLTRLFMKKSLSVGSTSSGFDDASPLKDDA
jgi:GNAT superfamily N-acetyltransferase